MWSFLVISMMFLTTCHCIPSSTIYIFEELPPGSMLANVADLFEISKTDAKYKLLECKILSRNTDGTQTIKRSKNAWVNVDEQNGAISLNRKIDRDEECFKAVECMLQTQVIRLPDQELVEIMFAINDINDNEPVFPTNQVEIKVQENTKAGELISLDANMAHDLDSGYNGELSYSLQTNAYFEIMQKKDKEGLFHLDLVCVTPIDYEDLSSIELLLEVHDGGIPSMTSSMLLNIVVMDTNDNAPIFRERKYPVTLRENSLPGQELVTVKADDADSGVFGQIEYYLSQRNDPRVARLVVIDSHSGVVALKEQLDRERDDGIKIRIEARDTSTSGQKVDETYVVINIEDVNDNAPEIYVNYVVTSEMNTAYIKENSIIGTYIGRVTTVDADDGKNGEVHVTISSTTSRDLNRGFYFALTQKGFIETVTDLDREVNDKYIVTITACDKGVVPKCSQKDINVVVLDTNEFEPVFEVPTQIISLYENLNIGSDVTTVRAYDNDAINIPALSFDEFENIAPSTNGYVTYTLANDYNRMFAIDSESGKISLIRQLDRETKKEWVLNIVATDHGFPIPKQTSCEVIIQVDDINDNRPFFVNPAINNSLVYSKSNHNQLITKLRAVDYDEGINANLIYSIHSIRDMIPTFDMRPQYSDILNEDYKQNEFFISHTTGELFISDNGASLGMKQLKIEVCDSGVDRLCSQMILRVMVTNAPGLQESSEENLLMVAAVLGGIALLLIITIPIIIAVCKKRNKKIKSFARGNESSRYDVINDVITTSRQHGSSFCSEKSEIKYTFVDMGERKNNYHDIQRTSSMVSGTSSSVISSPKNHPSKIIHCSISDGDSGRGDSEPDNTVDLALCDMMQNHQRLSSTCSSACLTDGHSDACWMPRNLGSNSSLSSSCVQNYYMAKPWSHAKNNCSRNNMKSHTHNLNSVNEADEGGVYNV